MTDPTPDNPFPIFGAGVPGKPQPRRNINDFATEEEYSKQWNLYLQAMINLQKHSVPKPGDPTVLQDINRPLGYYQLAGIHGLPFINWLEKHQPNDRPGNYCTHGTSLFLTWHRPYLLLLEQCLVDEAVRVAETFHPDVREDYKTEAQKIRLPYWDWATNSDVPEPLRNRETTISLPSEESGTPTTKTINNPLYSYKFESSERRSRDFAVLSLQSDTAVLTTFDETKRCPDAWGYSRPEVVDRQLRGPIKPIAPLPTNFRDGIYKLLMTVKQYGPFSNTGWAKGQTPIVTGHISLENYHNAVHNYVGTDYSIADSITGHMSEVGISAFDPIFWFHHANIDRLYALWQSIHYKSEFKGQKSEINRLPEPPSLLQDDVSTPLRPFYFDKDNVWTSKDVQKSESRNPSVFDLNYTYPEILFRPTNSSEQRKLRRSVMNQVRALYGPTYKDFQHYSDEPRYGVDLGVGGKYRQEWIVRLRVKKYLVKGNFIIFFFLGRPDAEPHKWVTNPNLVGSFHTFKSNTDYCANCLSQEEADAVMSGGVDLTNALYNRLQESHPDIPLDNEKRVKDWLAKNLEWRILKDDGKELQLGEIRGNSKNLKVNVDSYGMVYISDMGRDGEPEDDDDILDKIGGVYDPHKHLKGAIPDDLRTTEITVR